MFTYLLNFDSLGMMNMSIDYKKIGQRVKSARKEKGYTQEELASRIGISIPHMSHIETADSKVGLQTLVKVANALGITTNDLLYDNLDACVNTYDKDLKDLLDNCTQTQREQIYGLVKQLIEIIQNSDTK